MSINLSLIGIIYIYISASVLQEVVLQMVNYFSIRYIFYFSKGSLC